MLQPRQPVPLIGAKPRGFRYNRRDIQFDEPFEALSPTDAEVLVKAKLARRPPPPDPAARARGDTAAPADNRSRIVTRDAGIPAPTSAVLERKETAVVIVPDNVASSTHNGPPELGGTAPKKERVRAKSKAKAKAPTEPPAAQS